MRGKGGALCGAVAVQEVEATFADGNGWLVLDLAFERVQVVVLVFVLVERVQAVAGIDAGQGGAAGDVHPVRARGRGDDDAGDACGLGFGGDDRRVVEPVEVAMAVGVAEGHGFGACWEQWAVRYAGKPHSRFSLLCGEGFLRCIYNWS